MSQRSPLAAILGVVALGVAAAVVTVVVRSGDDGPAASQPATPAANGGQTPTKPGAGGQVTLPDDPEIQLNARVVLDQSAVEALVGQWVPQLSAKRDGIVDRGVTYDMAKILDNHRQLRDEYGALLLISGGYVFKSKDLYVSIAPQGSPTPAGALQFCKDHRIGKNDCFAKLITHDASITDTVEQQ